MEYDCVDLTHDVHIFFMVDEFRHVYENLCKIIKLIQVEHILLFYLCVIILTGFSTRPC